MSASAVFAVAASVLLALLVVLQLAVAAGAPLGRLAWRGEHRTLPGRLRVASLLAAAVLLLGAWVALARGGLAAPGPGASWVRIATWAFAGFSVLHALGNLASRSRWERAIRLAVAGVLVACFLWLAFSPGPAPPPPIGDPPARAAPDPAPASGEDTRLEASRAIVLFLRDGGSLDPALLADSVTLRLAPEGGGTSRTVAGERLTRRDQWWVGDYSLTPPAALPELTLRPGVHLNCHESELETRAPMLARLPHVGTQLAPRDPTSCLETWNLTLVFAPDADRPRLVAAVYDQWEW